MKCNHDWTKSRFFTCTSWKSACLPKKAVRRMPYETSVHIYNKRILIAQVCGKCRRCIAWQSFLINDFLDVVPFKKKKKILFSHWQCFFTATSPLVIHREQKYLLCTTSSWQWHQYVVDASHVHWNISFAYLQIRSINVLMHHDGCPLHVVIFGKPGFKFVWKFCTAIFCSFIIRPKLVYDFTL